MTTSCGTSTFILPMPPSVNGLWANSKHGGRFRAQRYDSWINRPETVIAEAVRSYLGEEA